jgi:hypothetical protein
MYVTPHILLASVKGKARTLKALGPRETPVAKFGPTFWKYSPPPMAFTLPNF